MLSLIVFPVLLFSSLQLAAANQAKRQGGPGGNGPAALPAFSHESNKFQLRIDKETLDFVNGKLGERPPKLRKKRRDVQLVDRQIPPPDVIDRPRVDQFVDLFGRLIREDQLVDRLAQEVAAVPDAFNPGWAQLENVPRLEDVNIQQAFVEVVPVAVIYIPQRHPAPRRPVFEFMGLTIMILGMIDAYIRGALLAAQINLNTAGVMENSCPNVQSNTCGQPFCKGAGTQCSPDSLFKNCQCEAGDCPASDKIQLFCDEKDCGGRDQLTGRCKGREGDGKHKNCYCGVNTVFRYPFQQSSFDALKDLVNLGEWKPPAPDPPKDEPIITDGSGSGSCGNSKTMGDRGIDSKPIDKNKLQRCLKNLDLDHGWFGDVDCEGLVKFQSGSNSWESVADCHNSCKNCLSQSIADGVNQIFCDATAVFAHCWMGYTIPDPPLIDEGDSFSDDQLSTVDRDGWIDKYAAQQCLKRLSWDNWFTKDDPPSCDVGNGRGIKFTKQGSSWGSARDCHNALVRCVSNGINQGGTTVWCDKYVTFAHCWFGFEIV